MTGLILTAIGLFCVGLANVLWFRAIFLVNHSSDADKKVGYMFHHPAGAIGLFKRYKALFPNGPHLVGAIAMFGIGFVAFFAGVGSG